MPLCRGCLSHLGQTFEKTNESDWNGKIGKGEIPTPTRIEIQEQGFSLSNIVAQNPIFLHTICDRHRLALLTSSTYSQIFAALEMSAKDNPVELPRNLLLSHKNPKLYELTENPETMKALISDLSHPPMGSGPSSKTTTN